jgi:hypothetical protein
MADFGRLLEFDAANPGRRAPDIPNEQRALWRELNQTISASGTKKAPGWLEWGIEMRHAVLHRGRGLNTYLPRR